MFSIRKSALVAASLCFGASVAQFQIYSPSSSVWWVANSQNVLSWTCDDNAQSNTYTVIIANTNTSILPAPMPFIAELDNSMCSSIITQDQANQPAATGYTILFANPLNNTDVYATSEEFEIKALGSSYPTTTVTPGAAGSATGSSGSSATGSSSGSAAAASKTSNSAVSTVVAPGLIAGAAAILGLMIA